MKYLLISDVHLSETPPSSCTDYYQEDMFDLLSQALIMAGCYQADAVVIAGDLFHHKTGIRTSHRLVQRLIRTLRRSFCPVYIVPGNHDMTHDRIASVYDTQPLGVVYESGAAKKLSGWGAENSFLYGVPWQQTWDDEHVQYALEGYRIQEDSALVVTHAPLYPPGRELPYENYPAASFADAMGNVGTCFYGHVHEPHGTFTVGGVTFCNYGALSRGSLHEYNLTRPVYATIWEEHKFDPIELSYRPADEVFRLQEKKQVTDLQGRLDEFLASISTASLEVVTTESIIAALREMELEPGVLALAEELLHVQ